ncbi:hypothetical protein [Hyalangium rubrum]|uniref:Lipoprotein n=1 Tax=Hyalangium rubrum TaxID=3103134 RepID=A0ABU5GZL5_9BACT|nr:hypothetical protein [Hyalangium sp. s54d21]MDY7226590.1 hypothetical protein [Hyalangium sp. s54d21]
MPWLLAVLSSGCVTVYQPLVSLQRPVVVDPRVANFEGQRMLVRCIPGDYLQPDDAEQLCRNVRSLFANQGAEVEVEVPRAGRSTRDDQGGKKPDLIIDLKARLVHEENSALLWALSGLTLTLVPAITESTFSQEITIRDSSGFLLASDTLQGRFVRYCGVGLWAVNGTLDLLVRSDEEDLTGDAPKKDFSKDFHGQLSQLAFNARMRSWVMRGFEEPPRAQEAQPSP